MYINQLLILNDLEGCFKLSYKIEHPLQSAIVTANGVKQDEQERITKEFRTLNDNMYSIHEQTYNNL